MKIYIKTLTGKTIELNNCEEDDTVQRLMQRVYDCEGIPVEQQRMIYAGKRLEEERTLWQYRIQKEATIHLLLRLRTTNYDQEVAKEPDVERIDQTRPTQSSTILPPEHTSSVNPPPGRESGNDDRQSPLAYDQGFDDDDYLLDPATYYDRLDSLEKLVVESSEYYHSDGQYQPTISHIDRDALYSSFHCDSGVSKFLNKVAPFSGTIPSTEASQGTICAALSLGRSYLILSHVLDIMEKLTQRGFCNDSFTVLIQRAPNGGAIAELVQIERDVIIKFHEGIATTIKKISKPGRPLSDSVTTMVILEVLLPACDAFMEVLGITFGDQISPHHVLFLCRVLTLILDIGLVSYMGSHGSRFDMEYLGVDKPEIIVASDVHSKIGFVFSLQKLACLDQFLNCQQVWTFQPLRKLLKSSPVPPLSILTSIEAFADTWGPLWEVSAGEEFPNHIRQLNVSTGLICRAQSSTECPIEDAIACHWFNSSGLLPLPSEQELESTLIRRNQKLLIGGLSDSSLKTNLACSYKLDDLERDYGLHMSPLGTSASSWTYDERQVGFSASQYIGITVLGTQKKLPCVTQKQAIWNKWTNQPTRANPRILNSYLGVEISHCTGSARRVKLRHLFTMKPIRALIKKQFPDWTTSTEHGLNLQSSFISDDDLAIEEVWVKYYKSREKIAELICFVLELLEKTGTSAGKFNAAFLNKNRELSMPIVPRLNSWTEFLEDSHLTAVYALVNQTCLDSGELGHFITTCNARYSGFTVFETQIAIPHADNPKDKIWLNQRGFLQRSQKTEGIQILTWEQGRVREFGEKIGKFLGSRNTPTMSREVQDENELCGRHLPVLVKSTVPSHGGLQTRRTIRQSLVEQKDEPLANSLPIRVRVGDSRPIQYIQQQTGPPAR